MSRYVLRGEFASP